MLHMCALIVFWNFLNFNIQLLICDNCNNIAIWVGRWQKHVLPNFQNVAHLSCTGLLFSIQSLALYVNSELVSMRAHRGETEKQGKKGCAFPHVPFVLEIWKTFANKYLCSIHPNILWALKYVNCLKLEPYLDWSR